MSYKQDKVKNKTTTQMIKTTFSRFFSKYFANEIREHNVTQGMRGRSPLEAIMEANR